MVGDFGDDEGNGGEEVVEDLVGGVVGGGCYPNGSAHAMARSEVRMRLEFRRAYDWVPMLSRKKADEIACPSSYFKFFDCMLTGTGCLKYTPH